MKNLADDINLATPTILVVDDYAFMRAWLSYSLKERFPGCSVIEAASGEEAIDIVSEQAPDIVLMDIGLPGMNGIEATRRIKSGSPKTKVVMFTTHNELVYLAAAEAAGASGYVIKSMEGDELTTAITRILSLR